MTYDFKMRHGVKTCEPCGRDEAGYCASSSTRQTSCADARCPFKNPDHTSAAFAARVAELTARFSLWRVA